MGPSIQIAYLCPVVKFSINTHPQPPGLALDSEIRTSNIPDTFVFNPLLTSSAKKTPLTICSATPTYDSRMIYHRANRSLLNNFARTLTYSGVLSFTLLLLHIMFVYLLYIYTSDGVVRFDAGFYLIASHCGYFVEMRVNTLLYVGMCATIVIIYDPLNQLTSITHPCGNGDDNFI